MKWRIGYFAIILSLFGLTGILYFYKNRVQIQRQHEDEIALSLEQKEEVVSSDEGMIALYRYKDSSGLWQVSIQSKSRLGQSTFVGNLFKSPVPSQVEVPVYLCAYEGFSGSNVSLDTSKNCSGEGKLVSLKPAGFLSDKVRTGFRLIARCRSDKHGMYISSRLTCENKEDRLLASLGSAHFIH